MYWDGLFGEQVTRCGKCGKVCIEAVASLGYATHPLEHMCDNDTVTVLEAAQGLDHSSASSSMRKIVLLLAATVPEWPVAIPGLGCVLIMAPSGADSLKKGQRALCWGGADPEQDTPPKLVFCTSEEPRDLRELLIPEETATEICQSLVAHPRKYLLTKEDNLQDALRKGAWTQWIHSVTTDYLGDALDWDKFVDTVRPRKDDASEAPSDVDSSTEQSAGSAELPQVSSLPCEAADLVQAALAPPSAAAPKMAMRERLVSVTARGVAGCGPFDVTVTIPREDGLILSVPRWAVDAVWANLDPDKHTRTSFGLRSHGHDVSLTSSYLGNSGTRPPAVRSTHELEHFGGCGTDGTMEATTTWTTKSSSGKSMYTRTFYKVQDGHQRVVLPDGAVLADLKKEDKRKQWLQSWLPMEERAWADQLSPAVLRSLLLKATGGGPIAREIADSSEQIARLTAAVRALTALCEAAVSDQEMLELRKSRERALCTVHQAQASLSGLTERLESQRLLLMERLQAAGMDLSDLPSSIRQPDGHPSMASCDEAVQTAESNIKKLESEPRPGPGAASVSGIEYMAQQLAADTSDLGKQCALSVAEMLRVAKRHALDDSGRSEHDRELGAARALLSTARKECASAAYLAYLAAESQVKQGSTELQNATRLEREAADAHEQAVDARAKSDTALPFLNLLDPRLKHAQERLRTAQSSLSDPVLNDESYYNGPMADFVRHVNEYLGTVCSNMTVRADHAVMEALVNELPVESSQLSPQQHTVLSLACRASLRRMGAAEQAAHYYAVVDSSDIRGIWSETHLRTLLRALIAVGGYGGVLCVDLPDGCADTVVMAEGAHVDEADIPDGQIKFID